MAEEFDTETFIDTVKHQCAIWKISSDEYKDKRKRDAAWEEVARSMVEDFDEKEEREKTEIVKELSLKWKIIRDTYSWSEKKRTRSGQPAAKGRQFLYARQMSFLQLTTGAAASEFAIPEEEDEQHSPPETSQAIEHTQSRPACFPKKATNSDRRSRKLEDCFLKFMNHPMPTLPIEPEDDIKSFFNSLCPTVRKLSDVQQLDFKADVLNLLRNYQRGAGSQLQPTAPQPYSYPQFNYSASQNFTPYPYPQPSVYPRQDSPRRSTHLSTSQNLAPKINFPPSQEEEIL